MDYYVVDAFTDKLFSGNPACICVSEKTLSNEVMQNIAFENNLLKLPTLKMGFAP
ncbi:PhzF family phenazine biosynthesis protein [Lachnospiraceae bacterium KK002]